MKNPFKRIEIADVEDLINIAFSSASKKAKKTKSFGRKTEVGRKKESVRISTVGTIVTKKLRSVVKSFPNINEIPQVYRELLEIYISVGELKTILSKISWTSKKIFELQKLYLKRVKTSKSAVEARKLRKEFYGRVSSLLKRVERDLKFLSQLHELKNLPDFKQVPTVIICGLPNVGKSSLLWKLTGSKPKIRDYPFTTQGIMLGYIEEKGKKIQILDTPGLLDRPIEKRNRIEKKAIAALKKLADLVIFVFDASIPLEEQENLLKSVEKLVKKEFIIVANKIDIKNNAFFEEIVEKYNAVPISCKTGENIDELKRKILNFFISKN